MLQESHGTELQSLSTAAVERLRLADRNLFILQTYEKRLVCQERHMVTIRGLSVNYNSRHKVFGSSYDILALPFVDFIEALRQPELIVTYTVTDRTVLDEKYFEIVFVRVHRFILVSSF